MSRTLVWVHSRLRRTDSISRPASSSSTDFTIGDISPSLTDPALLSVVGFVDGQFTGFITKERRNFIYTSTECTGPGFSALKASAGRPAQKNATSDVISSQPIACPSNQSRSRSRVFTDQEGRKCILQNSRLLWFQSLPCRPGFVVGSGVCGWAEYCAFACLSITKERHNWRAPISQSRVFPTSKLVMWHTEHQVFLNIAHKGFPSNCQIYK